MINSIQLEKKVILEIKNISPKKTFPTSSALFYEGQTPIVAFLLIDGSVQLQKKKKTKKTLTPGSLFGLNELMTNSPSKLSAVVEADSTVCFLDKSTIREVIQEENSPLASFLRDKTK